MITTALKEWSFICQQLIAGRQSLLLRKGGIAEPDGQFQLEQARFLLYPTFLHQGEHGVPEGVERPPLGKVRLEAWAEAVDVFAIADLETAESIAPLHAWSREAVEKRFHYRRPGLQVLVVRVHRLARPVLIEERTEYVGCKSWTPLAEPIDVSDSTPVLGDAEFQSVTAKLDALLKPPSEIRDI